MKSLNTEPVTPTSAYVHAADLAALLPSLKALVDEIVSSGPSRDTLARALDTGMTEVASLLRTVSAAEGRLLERGIGLVAGRNPDLVVLTQNLRLPVTKAASEPVEMNDPTLYLAQPRRGQRRAQDLYAGFADTEQEDGGCASG